MIRFLTAAALFMAFAGCSTFMKTEDAGSLKDLEQSKYRIAADVNLNGQLFIKSGTVVRLKAQTSSSWVKVYAISANEDYLSAERYLILYLFEEDFPKGVFSRQVFDEKLKAVAVPAADAAPVKPVQDKKPAQKGRK